jgi:hypothetical protein
MRALLVLALVVVLAGCAREQAPDAAYRTLAKAVADRDADKAWSLLSRASQKRLDAKARAAAAQAPGVVAPSAKQLLIGDAARLSRPISSIVVVRESADRAVLKVEVEGAPPAEVTLVREGGWRVELPGAQGS